MKRIERPVRLQRLHYLLSRLCKCGTGRNLDSIVIKICICPPNGSRAKEFQYSEYRTNSLYDINDTNFQGSTYFYLIGTKMAHV